MKVRVADVALDPRLAGSHSLYTYSASEGDSLGQAFFAPLGTRKVLGVIVGFRDVTETELGFDPKLLKPLGTPIEGLRLPAHIVKLVHFVAERYLCEIPEALAPALPPGILDRLVTRWDRIQGSTTEHKLTEAQQEWLTKIEATGSIVFPLKPAQDRETKQALAHLKGKGLIQDRVAIQAAQERRKLPAKVRLSADDVRIERFLANEAHRKPAQAFALSQLQGLGDAAIRPQDIAALGEITETTIRALIQAGLLEAAESGNGAIYAPRANNQQVRAIDQIVTAIHERASQSFLLFGVTGSGKTEVYLQAAAEALKQGRKVLYLVPEIALTAQVIGQLRGRFGEAVAVLHSNLNAGERLESWMRIRTGQAAVVVGPRSALFAPIEDLGLIIVDEEHEGSYKQDSTPRYQAHALVEHLSKLHGAPVVFGSATPCVESFSKAENGEWTLLELTERAIPDARMPTVFVEDLKELYAAKKQSLFTDRLTQSIHDTLKNGKQAILFLNRRAFAPGITCRDCGNIIRCPNCAVAMSLHKQERSLKCHHCDHTIAIPEVCPTCYGSRISPFGVGVEKVEEFVRDEFDGARVGRLDRDVTKRKGALEQTLSRFRSGELNVLVGTQMVAKGFDFPNVTLVGVVAADISLAVPEFRASERTFQLLSQVSGRAGRARDLGEVIIQTLMPDNPSIVFAENHNYRGFYAATMEERQFAGYPPFKRLINIVFTGEDRMKVRQTAQKAADKLKAAMPSADVLGPTDCAIERLQSNWRRHIVIKLHQDAEYGVVRTVAESVTTKGVRITLDVDPQSLM